MLQVEIDQGTYEPEMEVRMPYIALTPLGKVLLVYKEDDDDDCCVWGIVLKAAGDNLPVAERGRFDVTQLTVLDKGKSVSISNVWEITNG